MVVIVMFNLLNVVMIIMGVVGVIDLSLCIVVNLLILGNCIFRKMILGEFVCIYFNLVFVVGFVWVLCFIC